jgi:EpsI family protein
MNTTTRWMMLVAFLLVARVGQSWIGGVVESIDAQRPQGLRLPLTQFPSHIDDWIGQEDTPRPEVIAAMKDDEFLQRIYRHPSGIEVVLFFCHSKSGRDAYHYPTVCMTGRGWTEEESQRTVLDQQATHSSLPTPKTRFLFVNERKDRQLVYYWYYLIGESFIDETMRRLSQSSRLFLRGRTNAGLTVELFSPQPASDTTTIDHFARRVAEELIPFLPAQTRGLSELGANL